jgi:[ribosomal protein S5]-alanine N-acetyltransferase
MNIFAETQRLLLRQFTEDDADNLLALDSDPDVMRYIGPPPHATADGYRQMIRERFLPHYQKAAGGTWAVVEKASGDFLGWMCMRPALDHRFAREAGFLDGDLELGYRLKKTAWNKGYATEGSHALVRKAWTELAAQRIVACALVGNGASTRVMEKVGLKYDATFAMPGFEMLAVRYIQLPPAV